VLDPGIGQLAVVDEAVDAPEIDECAELGQPDDDAVADLTDRERPELASSR
jgi:hypothetical protein